MRFGYSIPSNQGFEDVHELVQLAAMAEAQGFDSVWASEHLFHSSYIAERLGNRPYFEPLTILTAVAGVTTSVRLGTSVLVLPWHDPARLAKTVATLDHLSNGRVDLGIGVAVTQDEFENLGVDFKSRGRRTNDALAAMTALWTQETPTHAGEFYNYARLKFSPKPKQAPYPPIHVGGTSDVALRRTAKYGDGWHALRQSPNQIREALVRLRELTEAQGRDPARIKVSMSIPVAFGMAPSSRPPEEQTSLKGEAQDIANTIRAYRDAGVQEIVMSLGSRVQTEHAGMLARMSGEVRPLLST